jgi:transcriptional regulator with XRE-family HTH domain
MKQKFEGLRARREELGLTIEGLAVKVGLSPAMVRAVELGLQRGTLTTRSRIADALKVPLKNVLTQKEVAEIAELSRIGKI